MWLGLWAAQLAPVQLLLPLQLEHVDPVPKVRDFGLVNGVAGVAALIALPVFGALSDRSRSRFGRRRVWVAGGIAVDVLGLLLTTTIADQVPAGQRGAVSPAVYGPQALGIVLGLVLVTGVGEGAGYPALAVVLVLVASPWLLLSRDAAVSPRPRSLAAAVRATWQAPTRHPDYRWAFGGRLRRPGSSSDRGPGGARV